MRIRVDNDRCQGHQMCTMAAPDLFESDEYGYAYTVGDGTVPPDLDPIARRAEANCPERAVLLEE
jgi:ferredoxin